MSKAGVSRRCIFTSQLINVYSKMTKTDLSVFKKKKSFCRLGYFLAANEHTERMK